MKSPLLFKGVVGSKSDTICLHNPDMTTQTTFRPFETIPRPIYVQNKPNCCCVPLPGVMLHLEVQEGKERMARLKYVEEFQATTACTVRMLAALSLGENSLSPDKNCNVLFLAIRGLLPTQQ